MPAGDDKIGDVALGLQFDLGTNQQGHYYRRMHVEGQSCRRAALAQRLVGQRMAQEADAGSTEGFRDAQLQEAFLAQPVVVLGGMRGIAVMGAGACGEISRELLTALPQLPVFLADREIQDDLLLSASSRGPTLTRTMQHRKLCINATAKISRESRPFAQNVAIRKPRRRHHCPSV